MKVPPIVEEGFADHGAWSVEGLVGFDGAEERGPPGRECFRCTDNGTSFSHDVLRAGLTAGAVTVWVSGASAASSSDEASASESGVERRTPGWLFSSLADAVEGGVLERVEEVCLEVLDGAAMISVPRFFLYQPCCNYFTKSLIDVV